MRSTMTVTRKSPGYRIDGRVSIALNALDEKQKQAVTGVLTDRARFVASTADRRKVRKISKDDPLYALSIPSGLRIIYSRVGDDIVVMDLMHKANLVDSGRRKAVKATASGTKTARAATHAKAK
jgi:hypothetical protein